MIIKFSVIAAIIILVSGIGFWYYSTHKQTFKTPKDPYVAFSMEIYDTIQKNYWEKLSDEQLVSIYKLAIDEVTNKPQAISSMNKTGLEQLISTNLKSLDNAKKKEFVANVSDIVLANLRPTGRSRVYSKKEEVALNNTVKNINPNVDQYQILGVDKNAKPEEVAQAFEQKAKEWDPKTNKAPEAKQEYKQIVQAHETLSDTNNKKVYDTSGVEPTINWNIYEPDIFYMHLTKFSPTTLDELQRVIDKSEGKNLTSLILDLRDNVGGAIDGLPYFIGPFIGVDQYAYQFFQQGVKEDFKTKVPKLAGLAKFKKIVILINENTQSSAEVMAAALKKYNVGILVGTPTKGWGTVEKVYPVEHQVDKSETFSVFLVHHLTLKEDGQPIEGNGVEPVVNIKDPNWEEELNQYFNSPTLIRTTKEILTSSSS